MCKKKSILRTEAMDGTPSLEGPINEYLQMLQSRSSWKKTLSKSNVIEAKKEGIFKGEIEI